MPRMTPERAELKRKALTMRTEGMDVSTIAQELGLKSKTVRQWVLDRRNYRVPAGTASGEQASVADAESAELNVIAALNLERRAEQEARENFVTPAGLAAAADEEEGQVLARAAQLPVPVGVSVAAPVAAAISPVAASPAAKRPSAVWLAAAAALVAIGIIAYVMLSGGGL